MTTKISKNSIPRKTTHHNGVSIAEESLQEDQSEQSDHRTPQAGATR
jgi:hypothetical protein